ncbi:MAG TPA: cytochrome c3 family protein [bacterium]
MRLARDIILYKAVSKNYKIVCFCLILFFAICARIPAEAANCTTSKCHANLVSQKSIHSALKSGGCTDCHLSDTGDHPFKLLASGESLCLNCHENPRKPMEKIHPALEQGTCTDCHDPHSSGFSKNLKARVPNLCNNCHENKGAGAVVHYPVKEGDCLACHFSHSSPESALLRDKQDLLCYACHERKDKSKFVHAAVAMKQCTVCHNPHSSDFSKLIKYKGETKPGAQKSLKLTEVCSQCHPDKTPSKANQHAPFARGNCITCHEPHGSNVENLLQKPSTMLCRDCHDKISIDGVKTRISQKLSEKNKDVYYITSKKWGGTNDNSPNIFIHGAVKTGRCIACHDPHQSDNVKLLRFARHGDLCYQCHSDDLTGRESVHPPAGEGDCLGCHSPHGSKYAKNLTEEPPQLCYNCHDKVDSQKVVHAAIKIKGCTGCHNPHGSDNAPLLVKPLNALCESCHRDKKDGAHIFRGFTQQLHPVSGPKDPKRNGKVFACVSCHNPHSSDNPKLFYEGNDKMSMCKRCH